MAVDKEALILAAAVAKELERRKVEEKLRYYTPHRKQLLFHQSEKRIKVATGGNRTGKSTVSAVEVVLKCLGNEAERYVQEWKEENKEWWYRRFDYNAKDVRVWCATVSWDVQRDVMQENIVKFIPKPILDRCEIAYRKKGVMDYILFPNGARLTFKSYETGWQGFQGASVDLVALDEEPPYDIWNECEKRIMDRLGSIIITYTPLSGLTWSYDRLYLNTGNDPEVFHVEMSWDDNPYLDEKEKQRLLANMSEEEREARIYGRYVIGGGKVFDAGKLYERRNQLAGYVPEYYEYSPERKQFVKTNKDKGNILEVYELPQRGKRYVIGVDVAQGLPEKDNSIACVIEEQSAKQVAELVGSSVDVSTFAEQVNCLGRWYNNAYIVPERNNDGKAFITSMLHVWKYAKLYKHSEDNEYGWPENVRTRPILIQKGQDAVKEIVDTINSKNLIEECLTFVRNSRGKPEAAGKGTKGGKKDDRVFAWMLAIMGREIMLLASNAPDPLRPANKLKKKTSFFDDGDEDDEKVFGNQTFAKFNPDMYVDFEENED